MIANRTEAKRFEEIFCDFERNRMYPLGYRKEAHMKRLTLKHVDAISHSEVFIMPALKQNMEPRHRNSIETDLELLADVKRWLLKVIYEPGLPMSPNIPDEPEHDGI